VLIDINSKRESCQDLDPPLTYIILTGIFLNGIKFGSREKHAMQEINSPAQMFLLANTKRDEFIRYLFNIRMIRQ